MWCVDGEGRAVEASSAGGRRDGAVRQAGNGGGSPQSRGSRRAEAGPNVVQRNARTLLRAMMMDLYGHLIDQNLWDAAARVTPLGPRPIEPPVLGRIRS